MTLFNSIYQTAKEVFAKIRKDDINAHAASASFFIIICFFPMIILFLSILKYTPISQETLLKSLISVTPSQLDGILSSIISEIYSRSSVAFVSVTALAALWTAGKCFLAFANALDNIYLVKKKHGYFFSRIMSSIYILLFIITTIFMMLIMTFGEMLLSLLNRRAPLIASVITNILEIRFLFLLTLFTLIIMFLYTFVPKRKTSFMRQFPGALFASAGWQLFSFVYSEYTSYSRSFSYMYGSLNTIIFVMLWLYFCMYILFLGAELNVMIETKVISIKRLFQHHDKRNE